MQSTVTPRVQWYYAPLFSLPVIVAALGDFLEIYDVLLFSIVHIPSSPELGLNTAKISQLGTSILNFQMDGLMLVRLSIFFVKEM